MTTPEQVANSGEEMGVAVIIEKRTRTMKLFKIEDYLHSITLKYHKHILIKRHDPDVDGGYYYDIYKPTHEPFVIYEYVTNAWTLNNAKEFIDSWNGKDYNWNVLS